MFEVRLKQNHSTGIYRRADKIFKAGEVVLMDKIPKAVAEDPWLVVAEIKAETKKEPPVLSPLKDKGK